MMMVYGPNSEVTRHPKKSSATTCYCNPLGGSLTVKISVQNKPVLLLMSVATLLLISKCVPMYPISLLLGILLGSQCWHTKRFTKGMSRQKRRRGTSAFLMQIGRAHV